MRTRRIPTPFRNAQSWTYLAAAALVWLLAGLLEPAAAGSAWPGNWLPRCPLRSLAGIPCPFCGITTGAAWLAHGHWREAWRSNILSPLLLLLTASLAAYSLFFRLLAGRVLDLELTGPWRRRLWLAGAVLIASSWIVNLLRIS